MQSPSSRRVRQTPTQGFNNSFGPVDSEYSTCLTLKSLQDRTFGCGTFQNDASELLFMNSEVLMKLDIDMERVNDFDPEYVFQCLLCALLSMLPVELGKERR